MHLGDELEIQKNGIHRTDSFSIHSLSTVVVLEMLSWLFIVGMRGFQPENEN
jgi:hypothetical protein